MPTRSGRPVAPAKQRYPSGLYLICCVGFAERFSFYLLNTFLVLHLNERLALSPSRAVAIYCYFLCGSYLTPLLGGRLADSRLGARMTTLLGCVPLCIGYLTLGIEHIAAVFVGLLLIIIGGGLFKPGMQALLFRLFDSTDPKRADGFSLYYVMINVGTLSSPLLGSLVEPHGGWLSVVVLASCGMLSGLAVLVLGRCHLIDSQHCSIAGGSPIHAGSLSQAKLRLVLILLAGVVFGVTYVQSHSSLLLWVRDRTDRRLGHFEVPVAWFAAAPSALVLLIAPLLSASFRILRRWHHEPSAIGKISCGILLSGLAFVPLWIESLRRGRDQLASPLWALGCLAMLATTELLVPALAPAEIMRLAPIARRVRWVSYWFVAIATGHMLGGWIHL